MKWCLAVITSAWGLSVWVGHGRADRRDELEENETVRQKTRKYANRNSIHVLDTDVTETDTKSELVTTKRETDSESFWIPSMAYTRSKSSIYLIHCVAGSCKSWELHRLEERLWDSPAALLHHPRRSGGLSHTSPSICGGRKKKNRQSAKACLVWILLWFCALLSFQAMSDLRFVFCFFHYADTFLCECGSLQSWCSVLSPWCVSTNCLTSCWLVSEAIPT